MISLTRDHGGGWTTAVELRASDLGALEIVQRTFHRKEETHRPYVDKVSEDEAKDILHRSVDRIFDDTNPRPALDQAAKRWRQRPHIIAAIPRLCHTSQDEQLPCLATPHTP